MVLSAYRPLVLLLHRYPDVTCLAPEYPEILTAGSYRKFAYEGSTFVKCPITALSSEQRHSLPSSDDRSNSGVAECFSRAAHRRTDSCDRALVFRF
jgi:hypothetical protein